MVQARRKRLTYINRSFVTEKQRKLPLSNMQLALSRFASLWTQLVLCSTHVLAQSTTAQITGTITDPSGAAIPAAQISVASDSTGLSRQTNSGTAGTYTVALLPPGVYRVTVVHDGFKPVTRSGVELQVDQVARLDFALQVGSMSERIEVTANAPLLDSDTSSLGQVIGQTQIVSLPLNGRQTFRLVS
jgi:hypothetical protein